METVTTRLFGGLGNQLFQYAVGKAVAERNKCNLILDTRETNTKGAHWSFALSHFNIQATIGDNVTLPPIRSKPLPYYLWRYFGNNPKFVRETHLGYNAPINTLGPQSLSFQMTQHGRKRISKQVTKHIFRIIMTDQSIMKIYGLSAIANIILLPTPPFLGGAVGSIKTLIKLLWHLKTGLGNKRCTTQI